VDEATRLKAREQLLRARVYRFLALVCAVLGLVMFLSIYFRYVDGDIIGALTRVSTVLMLLLPFLPACVLSWMAVRAERKFMAMLPDLTAPADKSAPNKQNK